MQLPNQGWGSKPPWSCPIRGWGEGFCVCKCPWLVQSYGLDLTALLEEGIGNAVSLEAVLYWVTKLKW